LRRGCERGVDEDRRVVVVDEAEPGEVDILGMIIDCIGTSSRSDHEEDCAREAVAERASAYPAVVEAARIRTMAPA